MPVVDRTGVAGSTLTGKKWYAVEKNNTGKWDLADTENGSAMQTGILQSDNKSDAALVVGDPISVRVEGESFAVAEAGIEEGVELTVGGTDGTVKTAVATSRVIATAIDPASAANVIFRIYVHPQGQLNA